MIMLDENKSIKRIYEVHFVADSGQYYRSFISLRGARYFAKTCGREVVGILSHNGSDDRQHKTRKERL